MTRITFDLFASHTKYAPGAAAGLVGTATTFNTPFGSGPATVLAAEVLDEGDAIRLTLDVPDGLDADLDTTR